MQDDEFAHYPVQICPVQTGCVNVDIVDGMPTKRLDYRHVHYPERLCKTVATIRVVKGSFSRIAIAKLSQHSKAKACELPCATSSDADSLGADGPVYLVGLAVQKVQPICHLQHIQHVSSWTLLLLVTPIKELCMQILLPAQFYKWSGKDCRNVNKASLLHCCCCFRLDVPRSPDGRCWQNCMHDLPTVHA